MEIYFTTDHHWILFSENIATIGLTENIKQLFGEIEYIQILLKSSDLVNQGEVMAVIEGSKVSFEVLMPISGVVVEINELLQSNPSLINEDPYRQAWLIKIIPTEPKEKASLISKQEYQKLISAQTP